jgi:hypothetical protein
MDAKTRYRRRLKLQAALARVLEVYTENARDGIPADKTTAELAGIVVEWLKRFMQQAGVARPDPRQEPDYSRYAHVLIDRRKATGARYNRRLKPQLIAEVQRLAALDVSARLQTIQHYHQLAADPEATATARRNAAVLADALERVFYLAPDGGNG